MLGINKIDFIMDCMVEVLVLWSIMIRTEVLLL